MESKPQLLSDADNNRQSWLDRHPYFATVTGCGLVAALLLPLHDWLDLTNTAMLLLLAVALCAFRFGRGPAVLASVLSVAIFDIGFVPPRGSFTVQNAEHIVVFGVMLAVALIVSHLSGDLRDRRQAAAQGEYRQRALYQLAAALNATLKQEQVISAVTSFLSQSFDADVRFHSADAAPATLPLAVTVGGPDVAVLSVMGSGKSAQLNDGNAGRPVRNLQALNGVTRCRGVLEIHLPRVGDAENAQRMETLSTVAELVAAALERLHYLEVAARTQSEIEAERLRNSLLATLSHDLRTPLTVLYVRADALREAAAAYHALRDEAAAVCEESLRTNRLCESLLDLAQIRSTAAILRREWVAAEEIVGAALATLKGVPGIGIVQTSIPADLPWLRLDALMFERVIANLIDNALKQGGLDQEICVEATSSGGAVKLTVRNSGSRFPDRAERLLEAFARGDRTDLSPGFGIGLATCQAIVAAHQGSVSLRNQDGFAVAEITLNAPPETMPSLPDEPAFQPEEHHG